MDIYKKSITELLQLLAAKELSAIEITRSCSKELMMQIKKLMPLLQLLIE